MGTRVGTCEQAGMRGQGDGHLAACLLEPDTLGCEPVQKGTGRAAESVRAEPIGPGGIQGQEQDVGSVLSRGRTAGTPEKKGTGKKSTGSAPCDAQACRCGLNPIFHGRPFFRCENLMNKKGSQKAPRFNFLRAFASTGIAPSQIPKCSTPRRWDHRRSTDRTPCHEQGPTESKEQGRVTGTADPRRSPAEQRS